MSIVNNIFSVSEHNFLAVALDVFRFQYNNNQVYKEWVNALQIDTSRVKDITDIPFLPLSFFKTHKVYAGSKPPEAVFESSGTTQSVNSLHHVYDLSIYTSSFIAAFEHFYGALTKFCVLGLLPSYLERKGSSLVNMVEEFIRRSKRPESGTYLSEHDQLYRMLQKIEAAGQPALLIGVTFGLLDFTERYAMQLTNTIVMETGGMKGRRKEIIREELHDILKIRLGVNKVHGEYGMTEMLSQAYSQGEGIFKPAPWLKMLIRDEYDPLRVVSSGKGILNVIDLANVYSCSFLATDDSGIVYQDGSFEVLGRIDNSDIRGCSLMISN